MRRLLRTSLVLALLGTAACFGMATWARSAPRPANLGLVEGHLTPCPPTPNCVASEQTAAAQLMPPLRYATSAEAAKQHLIEIVRGLPRTTFIADEGAYMAAEFRTPVIGFIDDVEFRFDDTAKVIHFRSASRLGRHDLGVNRGRMEAISDAFNNHTTTR